MSGLGSRPISAEGGATELEVKIYLYGKADECGKQEKGQTPNKEAASGCALCDIITLIRLFRRRLR